MNDLNVIDITDALASDRDQFTITTALKRNSVNWRRQVIGWDAFLSRLKTPTVTTETMAEYNGMSRAEKGRVKDIGGFVAGTIDGKRRLAQNVLSRSMVTLDIDSVVGDSADGVWDSITMFLPYSLCLYSTHSHRPEKPRLRLIIPLKEDIPAEAYPPLARKMAAISSIPMDFYDDTTYEVSRLMYWPSCSQDGKDTFVFKAQDGDLLDGMALLEREYVDWHDVSEWPTSTREGKLFARERKKQKDPLEKPGLIGAFCRTYTIHEAIDKFLSDVYEPTKHADRYTFKGGSTYGGLVLYDDKFAYSHHGTDPASGILCNAFDLVRIHLFGGLDYDAKEDARTTELPSYKEMIAFVNKDGESGKTLTKERQEEVKEDFDFSNLPESDEELQMPPLERTKQGELKSTIKNVFTVLKYDPLLRGKLRYDAFANKAFVLPGVPWGAIQEEHHWQDVDDSGLKKYLQDVYGLTAMTYVDDAKNLIFDANKYHPVQEYLKSLPPWDGVKRIETLFSDYLGADSTVYTREVAKIHLVAAVKRVFEPGCKYDTMVILAGKQGIGKSTFIRLLCGDAWFSDSLYVLKGKEAAELIQGVWHIELGEMSALKKSDRDSVKAFLSKNDDQYRVAYAKNTTTFPRQCVFWGTSNEYNFLRDPTGDRRSYPVDCGDAPYKKDIFKDLQKERDQIWAEAYALYKQGQKTYMTGEALKEAIRMQQEHKEDIPSRGLIQSYLEMDLPDNWDELDLYQRQNYLKGDRSDIGYSETLRKLDQVCALQIWCEVFGGKKQNLDRWRTLEFNDVLTETEGWERSASAMRFPLYGHQRGFRRKDIRENQ